MTAADDQFREKSRMCPPERALRDYLRLLASGKPLTGSLSRAGAHVFNCPKCKVTFVSLLDEDSLDYLARQMKFATDGSKEAWEREVAIQAIADRLEKTIQQLYCLTTDPSSEVRRAAVIAISRL